MPTGNPPRSRLLVVTEKADVTTEVSFACSFKSNHLCTVVAAYSWFKQLQIFSDAKSISHHAKADFKITEDSMLRLLIWGFYTLELRYFSLGK